MANPEHVEVVRQGADAIEKWQAENPGVQLDLSEASLSLSQFKEAYLVNAKLSGATLVEPDFSREELLESLNGEDSLVQVLIRQLEDTSIKEKRFKNTLKFIGSAFSKIISKIIGNDLQRSGDVFRSHIELWQKNERERFPASEGVDVLIAGFVRFVRVGIITLLFALIPYLIQLFQVSVMMQQNSKIQTQIDQQSDERRRSDRNRLIDILYQEKDVGKDTIETLLSFVSKHKKSKFPKANLRLRQEAILEFIKLEFSAGRHGEKLDLSRAILSHLDLININLTEFNCDYPLKKAKFSETHLEEANLSGAHLEGAILRNAHLEEAILRNAHLEGANLSGAHLEGANLSGAHLEGANLYDTHFEKASLDGVHLGKSNMFNTHLEGVNFSNTHLEGANFIDARLEGTNLSGAHLEGAFFQNAGLEEAILIDARLEDAILFNTELKGADLRGAHMEGADLRETHLEGAIFGNTHLQGVRVDSDSWLDDLRNLRPPIKNFSFDYWSIAERKDHRDRTIFILVAPVEAQKPNLEN